MDTVRTVGAIWNCVVWLGNRSKRQGSAVTGTDEAVDRPLMEVVFDAIDADNELADDAKYLVLAALEGAD